jgi:hypothetical protein
MATTKPFAPVRNVKIPLHAAGILALGLTAWTGQAVAALPLDTAGLIGHWDFEEDSGAVVKDVSGHGLDGAIQGQVIRAGGLRGKALFLNGSTRAVVPFKSILNQQQFTLISWVKSSERNEWQTFVSRQVPAGHPINYRLQISGMDGTKWNFAPHCAIMGYWNPDPSPDSGNVIGTTDVSEGRWHQVAGTFDGTYMKIYVDGRLEGTHHQDIPPTANDAEPLTLGASNFRNGSYFLHGLMDEVSIYNRPLSGAAIAAEYAGKHPEVHLGMRTHYGSPGDTLVVPLYLANFLGESLSSAQFKLRFDSLVVKLIDVAVDSGLGKDWPLHAWDKNDGNAVPVALGGAAVPFGYGEGELLRFTFVIKSDAAEGSVSALDLSDVKLDENGQIRPTVLPGRILVTKPKILYGDVDGNGEVNTADAVLIVRHVAGLLSLPDTSLPAFTLEAADVSGNGEITSYDGALVFQYSLGLIDRFPVEGAKSGPIVKELLKRASAAASSLTLEGPAPISGRPNYYRYRLQGAGLKGLLSGEFRFQVSNPIVNVAQVTSGVKGYKLTQRYVQGQETLEMVLATNDDVDQDQVTVLDIEVQMLADAGGPGLTLQSVYLDEGKFQIPGIITRVRPTESAKGANASFLTVEGKSLWIDAAAGKSLRVEAFDLGGRKLFQRDWAAAPVRVQLLRPRAARGVTWIRVTIDGVVRIRVIAALD